MTDFERYQNMIRKAAHYTAALWRLDYDDMEAQGYLEYCEALKRFDITRAGFGTYLTHRLRGRLNDYAKTVVRQRGQRVALSNGCRFEEYGMDWDDFLEAPELHQTLVDLVEEASQCVSRDAIDVLCWILDRRWEIRKTTRRPSLAAAQRIFNQECGWFSDRVVQAWQELSQWWPSASLTVA